MTTDLSSDVRTPEAPVATDAAPPWAADVHAAAGWQALALAELGRPLTEAEAAATARLAPEHVLDLLFPALSDAARHEALWALG
ncbi:MAG TPA: hypothetical protein VFZ77_08410 [Acidimicrobiales bacterium]